MAEKKIVMYSSKGKKRKKTRPPVVKKKRLPSLDTDDSDDETNLPDLTRERTLPELKTRETRVVKKKQTHLSKASKEPRKKVTSQDPEPVKTSHNVLAAKRKRSFPRKKKRKPSSSGPEDMIGDSTDDEQSILRKSAQNPDDMISEVPVPRYTRKTSIGFGRPTLSVYKKSAELNSPKTPDIPLPKFAQRSSIGIGKPSPKINQLLPSFYGINLGRANAATEEAVTTEDEEDSDDDYTILPAITEHISVPNEDQDNKPPQKVLTTWERMRLPEINEEALFSGSKNEPSREVARRSNRRQSMIDGLKIMNHFKTNLPVADDTNLIRLKSIPVRDVNGDITGCSKAIEIRNNRRLSLAEVGFEPPSDPLADERFKKLCGMLSTDAAKDHETRNIAAITGGVIHAKRMFRGFLKQPPQHSTITEN